MHYENRVAQSNLPGRDKQILMKQTTQAHRKVRYLQKTLQGKEQKSCNGMGRENKKIYIYNILHTYSIYFFIQEDTSLMWPE